MLRYIFRTAFMFISRSTNNNDIYYLVTKGRICSTLAYSRASARENLSSGGLRTTQAQTSLRIRAV